MHDGHSLGRHFWRNVDLPRVVEARLEHTFVLRPLHSLSLSLCRVSVRGTYSPYPSLDSERSGVLGYTLQVIGKRCFVHIFMYMLAFMSELSFQG